MAYLAICFTAGAFLADIAVHPARRLIAPSDEIQARRLAENQNASLQDVQITAVDGALLRGWSILPRHGNGNSVILLHGLSDNRLGMIGYAELFLHYGYGVLMPDARAHGQSGGALATYGLIERGDIEQWVAWMRHTQRSACVYGESMGAAQLLQALQTHAQFCAVAAESPFSNFREIAYDRVGQFVHSGPWVGRFLLRPIVEFSFAVVRWKYSLTIQTVSPEDAAANSPVPILLIHGMVDRNIPLRHSQRIQARNQRVVLWQVPSAGHCGAINADPGQFTSRVLAWFRPQYQSSNPIGPTLDFAKNRQSAPPN